MENVSWLNPLSARVFVTTRWKVIAACRETNEATSRDAIAELCQAYWQPVYVCIRHHGYAAHDAQDLTQGFFMRLLKGTWFEQLDEAKGRFRAYLLVSLKNFLYDQKRRRFAGRRGGGQNITISIDALSAEAGYSQIPATQVSPETLYERQWAKAVIDHTLARLRIELQVDGRESLLDHFEAILTAKTHEFAYEGLAHSLDMNVGALHTALHRLRKRFQMLIREEIARTVASRSEIDEELGHLRRLFADVE